MGFECWKVLVGKHDANPLLWNQRMLRWEQERNSHVATDKVAREYCGFLYREIIQKSPQKFPCSALHWNLYVAENLSVTEVTHFNKVGVTYSYECLMELKKHNSTTREVASQLKLYKTQTTLWIDNFRKYFRKYTQPV